MEEGSTAVIKTVGLLCRVGLLLLLLLLNSKKRRRRRWNEKGRDLLVAVFWKNSNKIPEDRSLFWHNHLPPSYPLQKEIKINFCSFQLIESNPLPSFYFYKQKTKKNKRKNDFNLIVWESIGEKRRWWCSYFIIFLYIFCFFLFQRVTRKERSHMSRISLKRRI